jgi:Cytochrome P460
MVEPQAATKAILPTMIDAAAQAKIEGYPVRRNISVLDGSGGNIAFSPVRTASLLSAQVSTCRSHGFWRLAGALHDVDFMEKDSKRFADSGGWGWAVFEYDPASNTFTPGTLADKPPQGNDAKCGFARHTRGKTRDYAFTDYAKR